MEGSSLTHGCVTRSTCDLRLSVKKVPKNAPKFWERSQILGNSQIFGTFPNFGNFPNFGKVPKIWEFTKLVHKLKKHVHAPELTSSSSSSVPPECRRDEVSHHQRPPTSAAAWAATRREGPCVPGFAPSPPHDEVLEYGHGMWRGARGRCSSATGRHPCPSPTGRQPCPSPTGRPPCPLCHPPAHLIVTLLVWRLT